MKPQDQARRVRRFHQKKRYRLLLLLAVTFLICSVPELFHHNQGTSAAKGGVGDGRLENAWLLPWSGDNYRAFSPLSYFVLDRAYVHHRVYNTVVGAYATCEQTCPGTRFRYMEAARKAGGRMWPHRTHQVGLSVDFMVPKKYANQSAAAGAQEDGTAERDQFGWFDNLGVWHYLLSFDESGKWSEGVSIDFETMARHLLALDDAARTNGLSIQKVILKINLKDEFFDTPSGRKLKNRGVYFARALPPRIDNLHDDHYHVDFKFR